MKGDRAAGADTLAVFGGSFNPPHLGHVLAVAYVLGAGLADRALVAPTFHHPFGKGLAPFEHRLRMVALAMAGLRGVEVSRIEEELAPPSYTYRTLEALKAREPAARLRFVIGSDLWAELPRWKRPERILELAPPLVVSRGGYPDGPEDMLPVPLPSLSSTELRERLREGRSTYGLLPEAVACYCAEHGLYQERDQERDRERDPAG